MSLEKKQDHKPTGPEREESKASPSTSINSKKEKENDAPSVSTKATPSIALSEKTIEIEDSKEDQSVSSKKPLSSIDVQEKESSKTEVKERSQKSKVKESNKQDTFQKQDTDLSKQEENVPVDIQKDLFEAPSKNGRTKVIEEEGAIKGESKPQMHTDDEPRKKSIKSSKSKLPSATAAENPEKSLLPSPSLTEVIQEKQVPYNPEQIDDDQIKAQVNEISSDGKDLNDLNDVVPDASTATFFEGYGIAAGHAEDEFGGLGLIGVFEDVTSASSRSADQQMFLVVVLFFATMLIFNYHRN